MHHRQRKTSPAQLQVSIYTLSLDLFYTTHMSVLHVGIYVAHAWCSKRPEEGARSCGTVATNGGELPLVWEPNPGPL